jgi:thiol-disulfide isomerase/thioredoxin
MPNAGGIMLRLIGLIGLSVWAVSSFAVEGPPRYQLTTGRVLHYSGEGTSKEKDANVPASTSKSTWRFTVLAQNPDGSARVLVRSASTYSHRGSASPERVTTGVVDLYPDGRCRVDRNAAMTLSPENVFPRLPADPDAAGKPWQGDVSWTGDRVTYSPKPGDSEGAFVFTGEETGPISRIYVTTEKSTFHFDRAKGVVTRIERESSQDYGFHSRGTSALKLDKEESLPAAEAEALAKDYATFTDALKQYADQVKRVSEGGDKAQQFMDSARATLAAAAEKVRRDEVKQEFKTKLEEHDRYASYSVESAKKLAEVLNKPAAEWSAKDLDDKPIALKDLRGKVVVMDFWYRGCGWCMYAMPQVKRLATDFKDKPVAVLGMNTDRELADARFVVKELGLDYPQVQADGIPEKFGVQGFPTLVIVDQEGNVRDVHVGYSPDLYEKVSKKVAALLTADHQP